MGLQLQLRRLLGPHARGDQVLPKMTQHTKLVSLMI
jgi:hypothetical protein